MNGRAMRSVLLGMVTACALAWTEWVGAQGVTGNTLLQYAASVKKVAAGTASNLDYLFAAYVQGFAFGTALALHEVDPAVCLPGGSDTGQYVRVIVQYLESNPMELHKEATSLAIAACRKAFPCREP